MTSLIYVHDLVMGSAPDTKKCPVRCWSFEFLDSVRHASGRQGRSLVDPSELSEFAKSGS